MKILLGTALMATMLAAGSGCAKPDWIDRTLVTVDVNGTWHGYTLSRSGGASIVPEMWLDLRQEGPKARGRMRTVGYGVRDWTPVEGTVAGDVLTFKGADVSGELTVHGDQMDGHVSMGSNVEMSLQRMGPSSPPSPSKE
jgi:hypothetical protein